VTEVTGVERCSADVCNGEVPECITHKLRTDELGAEFGFDKLLQRDSGPVSFWFRAVFFF
jgi:hypothetical protein